MSPQESQILILEGKVKLLEAKKTSGIITKVETSSMWAMRGEIKKLKKTLEDKNWQDFLAM